MMKANYVQRLLMLVLVVATMGVGVGVAQATPITTKELQVDVTGIADYDTRNAPMNVVRDFYVGAGALVTAIRWNVDLTANEPSYLSEMEVGFTDTDGNGTGIVPGGDDDFSGAMHYEGFQDLVDIGQAVTVGSDGILRLEFFDGFKDLSFDEPEGIWNAGTLTFSIAEVPEPATWALMLAGFLLLSSAHARRRSKH